jgi:hypothetical protein
MGCQYCIRPENEISNMNINKRTDTQNRSDRLKEEFESQLKEQNKYTFTNDIKDSDRTGQIEIKMNDVPEIINEKDNLKVKNIKIQNDNDIIIENNDKIESNNKENKNKKHNPPYWNESTYDDLEYYMLEISDDKSDKIFDLFNDIRIYPINHKSEAENYNVKDLIEKADKNPLKPNFLIKNESFYYQLREILLSISTTPMSDEEVKDIILNDNFFKTFDEQKIYCVKCKIENEEESVWTLLKENEDIALNNILLKYIDYCIICAMPIINSYDMKVYFLFLSNQN